jgi:hypothetical protein
MEWQPIETAPKDGSEFLSYSPDIFGQTKYGFQCVCFFDGREFYISDDEYGRGDMCNTEVTPTHWMPLPAPPKTRDE